MMNFDFLNNRKIMKNCITEQSVHNCITPLSRKLFIIPSLPVPTLGTFLMPCYLSHVSVSTELARAGHVVPTSLVSFSTRWSCVVNRL